MDELGDGGDGRADALALHEPGGGEDTVGPPTLLDGPVGSEGLDVDAARHDGDAVEGDPERLELERLVGAGRDDLVGAPSDGGLDPLALRGAGVRRTLVPALHDTERVEGLRDGDPDTAGPGLDLGDRLERGVAGHPEVSVHDVRTVDEPLGGEDRGERAHEREQLVLRHRACGAGVDVDDLDARPQQHPDGQVR